MAVVAGIAGTGFRTLDYIQARRLVRVYPKPYREEISRAILLWIPREDYSLSAAGGMSYLGFVLLEESAIGILGWLCLTVLLGRKPRSLRWDRPGANEIRLLPITSAQIMVGRFDWRFLKGSVCLFPVSIGLVLPARVPFGDTWELILLHYGLRPDWILFVAVCVAWVFLFGVHRTVQRLFLGIWTIGRSGLIGGWLGWFLGMGAAAAIGLTAPELHDRFFAELGIVFCAIGGSVLLLAVCLRMPREFAELGSGEQ